MSFLGGERSPGRGLGLSSVRVKFKQNLARISGERKEARREVLGRGRLSGQDHGPILRTHCPARRFTGPIGRLQGLYTCIGLHPDPSRTTDQPCQLRMLHGPPRPMSPLHLSPEMVLMRLRRDHTAAPSALCPHPAPDRLPCPSRVPWAARRSPPVPRMTAKVRTYVSAPRIVNCSPCLLHPLCHQLAPPLPGNGQDLAYPQRLLTHVCPVPCPGRSWVLQATPSACHKRRRRKEEATLLSPRLPTLARTQAADLPGAPSHP